MRRRATRALLAIVFLLCAAPAEGAFPGRNGRIALQVDLPFTAGASEIFSVNPDASALSNLTNWPTNDWTPEWSADGTKIAFERGNFESIYVMNADGTGQHSLTASSLANFRDPAWSPDGKIAFSSNLDRDGSWHIYVMNSDGSGVTRLTSGMNFDAAPRWSPDGTKIAFNREDGGCCHPLVWVMNADGTGQANLTRVHTSDPFVNENNPEWSPDGTRLVFWKDDPSLGYTDEVFTMNANGTGVTRLTQTQPGDNAWPVWSPDGTKIAFVSWRDEPTKGDLFVMNVDGTGAAPVRPLPSDRRDLGQLSWQPLPNRPPDCSHVTASPGVLWPPNRKLVLVTLAGATDPDDDQVTISVTAITQDEPTSGRPDAELAPRGDQVGLRADRSGGGDGRVYRIPFTASDGDRGTCTGTATVGVPHNEGTAAVDSAPPSYDSLHP
jgi:hypothetical protein